MGEIKTFEEYAKYFEAEKTNNKKQVVRSTYNLNELLHKHGIPEETRSQFVGSVLLALKNGLKNNYKNSVGQFLETSQILDAIKNKINELLGSNDQKNKKIKLIKSRFLMTKMLRIWRTNILVRLCRRLKPRFYLT